MCVCNSAHSDYHSQIVVRYVCEVCDTLYTCTGDFKAICEKVKLKRRIKYSFMFEARVNNLSDAPKRLETACLKIVLMKYPVASGGVIG